MDMRITIWSTLVVRGLIPLGLFDSSGYLCSYVTFETPEQHCCRHESRKHHHQCTQATGQELVQIPAFTTLIRLDECCSSRSSYQWTGWLDNERNADVDLLEQVNWHHLPCYTT
jgi:hypothetical protein